MTAKQWGLRMGTMLIWVCLLALGGQALAQGNAIAVGQNATGSIDAANGTVQYQLTAAGGSSASIQVLALQLGFTPSFRVLDPSGVEIASVANTQGLVNINSSVSFASPGTYTIEVGGVNGSTGQFALSVQPGAPAPQAIPLVLNAPTTGSVDAQTPLQLYSFDTTSLGAVTLTVLSQTPNAGPLVSITDMSTQKTIASSDSSAIAVSYGFPANARQYQVSVRAGETPSTFSICIGACAGGIPNGAAPGQSVPIVPPQPTVTLQPAGCTATPNINGSVNLRSGPGTEFLAQGRLPAGASAQVVAEVNFTGWYEVNYGGQTLWVGSSVVALSGDCASLPRIQPPANAQLAPSATPTTAPTNPPAQPTATPSETAVPKTVDLGGAIIGGSQVGGQARVAFTVFNIGTGDVTQSFLVQVCISGQCATALIDDVIPAGGAISSSVDIPHVSQPFISEPVSLIVDPDNLVPDVNRSNNGMSMSMPFG